MKTSFSDILMNVCPKSLRLPIMYNYYNLNKRLEDELVYLQKIISEEKLDYSGKRAIDIGANYGFYSYVLSRYFRYVEAFEPEKQCFEMVQAYSQLYKSNINVHHVALANCHGNLNLYTPIVSGKRFTGLSSFTQPEEECTSSIVPVKKLDDYNFDSVSFLKIDVEGHEGKVIEGASSTIQREKPFILVEIEQRHLQGYSIYTLFELILSFGYQGSFLLNGNIYPLSEFVYEKHQQPFENNLNHYQYGDLKSYVNNFLFKPN